MKLSVIDNHPPAWAATLVPFLDLLGYSRYWTTEQHTPIQSGSPMLMAAAAGARCKRMRIGTAGVMLRINNPHRVLADFKALQFLYPGRVDMGFIPSARDASIALYSRLRSDFSPASSDDFADRVRLMVGLVRGEDTQADDHVKARSLTATEIWLCGSSEQSAHLAAELGIYFAYHDRRYVAGPGTGHNATNRDANSIGPTGLYLKEFRPHSCAPGPRLSVACYGICAETMSEAKALWDRVAGCDGGRSRSRPGFCGRPDECRAQLLLMQQAYGAHELVVQSMNPDLTGCLRSYSLLAGACLEQVDDPPPAPDISMAAE